jgi:signal transduction histidine kinase
VGDLETLARYDGESVALCRERFDISELLKNTALSFEAEFQSKRINLLTDISAQTIEADKDKVRQIFTNILSNALKYTPDGGTIEMTSSTDGRGVRISVKDTGIGISPADLPFIFERFYRADTSRSRATGGSGIGLAIAKSLTEAHGGRIQARSEPGKGSEFIVVLPC